LAPSDAILFQEGVSVKLRLPHRGDMFTSEQHRCSNEKKEFQRRVYLRGDAFINLYTNFYSGIMTGLQLLRHFQRIALPAYHPTFFIP
ncbi:hypothetical protein PSZ53_21560, partial [Shigella sonnei]